MGLGLKVVDAFAADIDILGAPDGLVLIGTTVACMQTLLGKALSPSVISPGVLMLLALPIWPVPILVFAFLAAEPLMSKGGMISSSTANGDKLSLINRMQKLCYLAAWAILHVLFTRAVRARLAAAIAEELDDEEV